MSLGEQARAELDQFAYVFDGPTASGRLRREPEDFQVDEILGFEPDGEGEHVLLHLWKRNTNTEFAARELGRLAGVKPVDVSYAGMKDRNAVTTQWFSIRLAGRPEPDWNALDGETMRVLSVARHSRKLRRGALQGNRFRLVVRDLNGDRAALEERLAAVAAGGVPNYFGEQRFGRGGMNLVRADAMFGGRRERDRHKRGLYLSAARSFLFNRLLSARVARGDWDRPLPGEVLIVDGRRGFFPWTEGDTTVPERVAAGTIHPTGPLYGDGPSLVRAEAKTVEEGARAGFEPWIAALAAARMEQERRALRLTVRDFGWQFEGDAVVLEFALEAGAYATTVLRELVAAVEPDVDG